MKFVCFGHLDAENWATLSSERQTALVDACFAYDESLQASGVWAGGEGLQGPPTAKTLRLKSGKVSVTDGPFAETKELLGGLLVIEARDIDHAVEIMAKHPGVNMGPWEIRPKLDLTPMIRESQERRAVAELRDWC